MIRTHFVFPLLCVACGADPSAAIDGGRDDAGGRDAAVAFDGGGLDGGAIDDAAIADAGADAGSGARACDLVVDDIVGWMDEHQSCGNDNPCELIIAPSPFDPEPDPARMFDYINHPRTCGRNVAAPDGERDALTDLVREYVAGGCVIPGLGCGFTGGVASCVEGACVLADTGCGECDETIDPVCTADGRNAQNPCRAERCFGSTVAHAGFCDDSAACVAAGGMCNEASPGEPPCPDGLRPARPDRYLECASGYIDNTCCVPSDLPCPDIEGSYMLALDPFSCGAVPPASVCVNTGPQTSCVLSGSIRGAGGAGSTIDLVVSGGGATTVTGTDPGSGRTFECTTTLVGGPFGTSTWRCRACSGPGACSDCTIESNNGCAIK
jgi:hypothetical protein